MAWVAAALLLQVGATAAHAQAPPAPLLDEVRTIGRGAAPVERTFEISRAGSYDLVLRDLGVPATLNGARLAVTRGRDVVATLDAPGTVRFTVTVTGTHVVRVVTTPRADPGAGSFGVTVTDVDNGVSTLEFSGSGSLPPPAVPVTQRIVDATFSIADAGTYDLFLTDLALPQALLGATVAITRPGAPALTARLDAPGTASFTATAGSYQVFLIADAAVAPAGGLVGVRVVSRTSGASVYSRTFGVGRTTEVGEASLVAGPHSLSLRDIGFPAALVQRSALVVRDSQPVARATTPGQVPFTAVAGSHQVFAYAVAAVAPGAGAYEVQVQPDGAAPALAAVRTAGAGGGPIATFVYSVDIATAGAYRARLADFGFPSSFSAISLGVWQGSLAGTLVAPGTLDANLEARRAYLLVSATPASTGSGLLGVALLPANATSPTFETTQGVGALFRSRSVAIAAAGRHDVTVRDLAFPANFADFAAVVTRGVDRVGSIFGAGTFSFDAIAATYFVNFIAQPGPAAEAGTYSLTVAPSPPPPTVSLSSSSANVVAGATVDLTWSSERATTCSASGGWSGARSTSGSERTAAINPPQTFSLACDGPGGRASASVTVGVATPPSGGGGGGGSASYPLLLLLMFAALWRLGFHWRAGPDAPAGPNGA